MKRIISIICVLVSLIMLCTIQYKKNYSAIAEFRAPELQTINPQFITIHNTDCDNSVKNITSKENLDSSLYASASCLLDVASGRVLFAKNADTTLPMASTTKIMTCILAIESGKLQDTVTVSKYASTMPDVQLNMKEGEQYVLNDLLYSLMLESHNDTAVAIAEHIGGSVEGFAAMMNNKAAELGCWNTSFVTPNGLDADNHFTTARELCNIAAYALCNQTFKEIIATGSHTFTDISGKRSYTVNNHDSFLSMYEGALGIKTGFTGKAGYCFVGAAAKNNETLVSAVLASGWPPHKTYKWSDTKSLMDYGFNNYSTVKLLSGTYSSESAPLTDNPIPNQTDSSTIRLCPLSIHDENNMSTSLQKKLDISFNADCSLPLCASDIVTVALELPDYINAPVAEGEIIGTASLCLNNEDVAEFPITANKEIPALSLSDITGIILKLFMI